jgi:putative methyltransferase (TIGR04325 family)
VSQARLRRALELRDRLADSAALAEAVPRISPVVEALNRAAAGGKRVSVLDWGGGYGQYAWAARHLLPGIEIDYHVVEVSTVFDYASALFSDVTYYDHDDAALARSYDVVLAIGSLHCSIDWRATADRLGAAARRFLLVMDLPSAQAADGLTLQERPLAYLPEAVCLGGIVDDKDLCARLSSAGLPLERDLVPWETDPIQIGPLRLTYRSFLFARAP